MTPQEFIDKYKPYAIEAEQETGISHIAILAQAALESNWGNSAIGNNIFGIKYKKGDYGHKEVLTTEHSKSPNQFKGKNIKSKTYDRDKGVYVYKLLCYFADYPSPKEAFIAHAELLLSDRYRSALRFTNPKEYLAEIARLGYATDIDYARKMSAMVDSVTKRL